MAAATLHQDFVFFMYFDFAVKQCFPGLMRMPPGFPCAAAASVNAAQMESGFQDFTRVIYATTQVRLLGQGP